MLNKLIKIALPPAKVCFNQARRFPGGGGGGGPDSPKICIGGGSKE